MKSHDELLSMIDRQMEKYADSVDPRRNRVGFARRYVLKRLRDKIAMEGFPLPQAAAYDNRLMPYIFQECHYDNEDLFHPKETLVKDLLDIDFYVAFNGKEREEVTESEFHEDFTRVIDWAKQRVDEK